MMFPVVARPVGGDANSPMEYVASRGWGHRRCEGYL